MHIVYLMKSDKNIDFKGNDCVTFVGGTEI